MKVGQKSSNAWLPGGSSEAVERRSDDGWAEVRRWSAAGQCSDDGQAEVRRRSTARWKSGSGRRLGDGPTKVSLKSGGGRQPSGGLTTVGLKFGNVLENSDQSGLPEFPPAPLLEPGGAATKNLKEASTSAESASFIEDIVRGGRSCAEERKRRNWNDEVFFFLVRMGELALAFFICAVLVSVLLITVAPEAYLLLNNSSESDGPAPALFSRSGARNGY
ncbi:hypothetical protein MA16_Dca000805 [Dendrobium catenatum]|uniref:Uncharacterized protein n=1 Tax=Dendrobium catenatum TaxID=906689 RepID=A0A2I0WUX4_9ASPA|nr:hypothetical protein MA16_Dca000805 [Dendrobium catenatum]